MPTKFDFISPGVVLNEVDESVLPSVVSDNRGPLIIGRSLAGPAMKPIRVKTLDDFNELFGIGISGKGNKDKDIWRNGNSLGPTYGVYAAQAHLAAQTTPVTFVRLLGQASTDADDNSELAGWSVSNAATASATISSNASAYGLFVFPATGSSSNVTSGSLAAVFYVTGAALALTGTTAKSTSNVFGDAVATASCGTMINSLGGSANKFKMALLDTDETVLEVFDFNFSPGTSDYIRDVFNTNPQLLQANKNFGLTNKSYFLGETFEESVRAFGGTSTTAGEQKGILLALGSGSLNFADHKKDMLPAKSGWFFNRFPTQEKLFRVVSLHDGEWMQNNYSIRIKDLALGSEGDPTSTFTLEVINKNGRPVETYSGLNLIPGSEKYISKVIGDQYFEWDSTNLKYNIRGEYPNNSNYIYIEVASAVTNEQLQDKHALPVGFYGPLRPKQHHIAAGRQAPHQDGGDGQPARMDFIFGTVPTASAQLQITLNNGEHFAITASSANISAAHTTFTNNNATIGFTDATSGSYASAFATLLDSVDGYSAQVIPETFLE
jgi:hypothetical protein